MGCEFWKRRPGRCACELPSLPSSVEMRFLPGLAAARDELPQEREKACFRKDASRSGRALQAAALGFTRFLDLAGTSACLQRTQICSPAGVMCVACSPQARLAQALTASPFLRRAAGRLRRQAPVLLCTPRTASPEPALVWSRARLEAPVHGEGRAYTGPIFPENAWVCLKFCILLDSQSFPFCIFLNNE